MENFKNNMTLIEAGEGRMNQELMGDAPRIPLKCRIPQRLPQLARQPRQGPSKKINNESRPRSGNRLKEEVVKPAPRTYRTDYKSAYKFQRTATPRRMNELMSKQRPLTVAVPPRQTLQRLQKLPDQDTIRKWEEIELLKNNEQVPTKKEDNSDNLLQIKANWQENIYKFHKMKADLDTRQKEVMEFYANLRNTQQLMATSGQQATLPGAEDLKIMNIAKLKPDQLLQLCSGKKPNENIIVDNHKTSNSIDMNKLYDMPTKLVATCEQTLIKRKEIIDWFDTLTTEEKGISMVKLTKKISEFNAENEMLNSSLQTCKTEFLKELNVIVDYLRKVANETIVLQLRTEELTYEVSDLNSQNNDLRKQLHAHDQMRSQTIRHRLEELEKELKEEKCKKAAMKERCSKVEGQKKISDERSLQLEAALEQERSQNWTLERTVQTLNEQNQKLQTDFDQELNKLTQSIAENSEHLEEIANAREKLQLEKEELEKRLENLSQHYHESVSHVKDELNNNVAKLVEGEKKLDREKEERKKLEAKLESLCAQLLESELRYKEMLKQLQEKDSQINKTVNLKSELDCAKRDLELANLEIEDYRKRLVKQSEAIKDIEHNFKDAVNMGKKLTSDLQTKEAYIAELEDKQTDLMNQLQETEQKMEAHEEQLTSVKNHIAQLKNEFGEFENMSQLLEKVNEQRTNLNETTRKNEELTEDLHKKNEELERHLEYLSEQETLLEKRDCVIKVLNDKDEEQANIIKLLRNNLEIRTKTETELTQKLAEKNAEVESLITNVETRKEQISQLEKIILTLEDQLRKVRSQRKKDHEKISFLEKAITDYESYRTDDKPNTETPVDNLDNLIRILEEELGTCFDPKQQEVKTRSKKKYAGDFQTPDTVKRQEHSDGDARLCHTDEKILTKTVLENCCKKTYNIPTDEERDNLNRKKAITNIDIPKWKPNQELSDNLSKKSPDKERLPPFRGIVPLVHPMEKYLSKNFKYLMTNHREEKKCKMFKFAGHRL